MERGKGLKKDALESYLRGFGVEKVLSMKSLGRGAHGEGWLIRTVRQDGGQRADEGEFVIKTIRPAGLGHDYPSDRAGMFILALDTYNTLPNHVKALDVISLRADGALKSLCPGKEYYLLMLKARGRVIILSCRLYSLSGDGSRPSVCRYGPG